jgi:hypothetical protein
MITRARMRIHRSVLNSWRKVTSTAGTAAA